MGDRVYSGPPTWYYWIMNQGKFTVTSYRIMTPEEAFEKSQKLNLAQNVQDYIVKQFQSVNDRSDRDYSHREDYVDAERITGENGRIAWGMSWEGVFEELGEIMGYQEDEIWDEPEALRATYDEFFEE